MSDTHQTIEDDAVLRKVGRYEILREVGRGGTAVVYLARQTDLERRVALKELAAFHAADPAFAERFIREARLAGSLNHPNIVTVHEYFEHEGAPFMAMEYFERGSLRPLVGHLTLPQSAAVLEGVLAGLKVAEKRGIVHRDLKPENVMVTSDGGVKITDFGIAKALQATPGTGSLTSSGSTVGTPAYMAPELALGNQIGPWTDLYALGVMAYELLAGSVPFDRSEMPIAILLRHVNQPVAPLRSLRPELDPLLASWVEQLLAKDPAGRPASAATAADELEEVLIGLLGARWRREAALGVAAAQPASPGENGRIASTRGGVSPPTAAGVTLPRLGTRRRARLRWLAACGALVAAGVVATAVALTGGKGHQAASADNPTGGTGRLVADLIPAAADRVAVAVSGPTVFLADPRGRVIALDRSSLRLRALSTDPAGPLAMAVHAGRLFVADGRTITQLAPDTLSPVAARSLVGATMVSGGAGTPIAATAVAAGRTRVCTLGGEGSIGPCATLAFSASGVGVAGDRVFVLNGRTGAVTVVVRRGVRLLRSGEPVAVGAGAHGTPAFFAGKLYVPVRRGVAVVDFAHRTVRRIALPVTPAAIWVVPFSGRLFAVLPATGQVALVDTAHVAAPRLVSVGKRPVAVAGGVTAAGPREVVVVDAGSSTVLRLDAGTGARLGSASVSGLGAPTAPLVLRNATGVTTGDRETITLTLAGRGLDPRGLKAPDLAIRDGSAAIELWQGAISSSFETRTLGTVALRVGTRPGRLAVNVAAAPGSFTSLAVTQPDRRTVVLELVRAPRVGPAGGSRSSNTGTGKTKTTHPTKPGGTTTTPLVQD